MGALDLVRPLIYAKRANPYKKNEEKSLAVKNWVEQYQLR